MDAQQVTGTATVAQWKLCCGSVEQGTAKLHQWCSKGGPALAYSAIHPGSALPCLCLELAAHQPGIAMLCRLAITTAVTLLLQC